MAEFYDKDKLVNDRAEFVRQRDAIDLQITELEAQKDLLEVNIEQIDDVLAFIDAGYPNVDVLATPADFVAVTGVESASLDWDAVTDATNYVVEMATNPSFADASEVYSGSATDADITDLTTGLQYYFRVKATASGKADSAWATTNVIILDKLATPTGLILTTGDGNAKAVWDDVPFAMEYNIYRTTTNVPPVEGATPLATTAESEYTDEDPALVVSNTYWYWIEALNESFIKSDLASGSIVIE